MTVNNKRYSEALKRQVVTEFETGVSIADLKKKYGITGTPTIPRWINKYSRQGFRHGTIYIQSANEIDQIKVLEKQVKELQQALGRMTLDKLKLESILQVLQGDDEVVKKNDHPSSKSSLKKPPRVEPE